MDIKACLISILLFFLFQFQLVAGIKASQSTGNWNATATWGGVVPVANDDIIISPGTTVYLNSSLGVSSSFGSLVIKPGGILVVGLNSVFLRLNGNLTNDGTLDLWKSASFQADIMLYGNSLWSGAGSWNLSDINVQGNSLEVTEALTITINGSITAYDGASFNKQNKYTNTTLNIRGTLNSIIPSHSDFYYGNLVISKTTGTVNFQPSASSNMISLLGDLSLVNATDRLNVEDNNTLSLQASVLGAGVIAGSTTSSLVIDNLNAPAIDPLRILNGTSFSDFIINRRAGVTLANGFIIRERLVLNNYSVLTLPPQTLILGVNGTNPTAGKLSGDGSFIGSINSSISIRGKDTASVMLRFDQASSSHYTLNNLIIDKTSGKAGIANGNLLLAGKLDISDRNIFSLGTGTLMINIVPRFIGSGCLSGSKEASLTIGGSSVTGYSLAFDQVTPFGNTLKTFTQTRNTVITLANKLNISEGVSLTGNSSILASDGNLTLLSGPDGNASISTLSNNADVKGDVNVQVYLTGDNNDLKYRGYRSLSSPLNDEHIPPGGKKSFEQLKQHIIITGRGGVANGFDQGGSAQPFAETIMFYDPLAAAGQLPFFPLTDIKQSLTQGTGFLAFFRGMQKGNYSSNYNKLNSPYVAPEAVTITYQGPVNKFDLGAITLRNSNDSTDAYRGYNLIGNPYPSSIDWAKVTKSAEVNDEIIMLKPGGGVATYLNGFSNNGGSKIIQTGQGFYVRATAGEGTVSFREDSKSTSLPARLLAEPPARSMFTEKIKEESKDLKPSAYQLVKLTLTDDLNSDETTVVFKGGESDQADYHDAMYFGGGEVSLASMSANGKRLAINLMAEVSDSAEVKLSVNAVRSGKYSLNFTEVPEHLVTTFIEDAFHDNRLTEIKKDDSYSFSIDKKDPATFGDKRFSLIFKSKQRSVVVTEGGSLAVIAYPNPVSDKLYFNFDDLAMSPVLVRIFGMKGEQRQLSELQLAEDHSVDVSFLEPGIYVAKLDLPYYSRPLSNIIFIKL